MDSTNYNPPYLGPQYPTWPLLPQVCRVYGSSGGSSSSSQGQAAQGVAVYAAYVQQWQPGPSLRDREACYVWEPNGTRLGPGYYYCRLTGTHAGIPLFTTCFLLGGTVTGNTLVVGAVLAGLSASQAFYLSSTFSPAQVTVLNNLTPCQLQTFLTLPVDLQLKLVNNLTPPQITAVVSNTTPAQLQPIASNLTPAQLQTFGNFTPPQASALAEGLTSSQIQTLIVNLTPTQIAKLTNYPPNTIGVLAGNLTTPQLQTLLNLNNLPVSPLFDSVGQNNGASKPPLESLLQTMTGSGPPTYTPTSGSYPFVESLADGRLWMWNGSKWSEVTPGVLERTTAAFDSSTDAMATITDLDITVLSGRTYEFELAYEVAADVTGGLKVAVGGSCTASAFNATGAIFDTTTAAAPFVGSQTTLGNALSSAAGSTSYWVLIKGTVAVSGTGKLRGQFAQVTPSGTSTVNVGAKMSVREVSP